MSLIEWWHNLKWMDKSYDVPEVEGSLKRAKPLTWKELFFRDKFSVIFNFGFALVLLVLIIIRLITGGV